jgi:hypothetical protein
MKGVGREGLAAELAGLSSLPMEVLQLRWRKLFGRDPPSHTSRSLLIRAVAYRLQESTLGGLKPQTRRMLARHAGKAGTVAVVATAAPTLSAGTRLVREWRGTTYQVIVVEKGVLFHGQRYASLSEVARIITGCRWSGPRFFGLTGKDTVRGEP